MTTDEWSEFLRWWPIWSPAALLLLGGMSGGIWVIISRRGGEKAARRNPLPPTWPEMWARIDKQEERIDALELALAHEQREKAEIVAHVRTLEAGYPNPPGPPPRPWALAAA